MKGVQSTKAVSSFLGAHLSGKVTAWVGVTGGFCVVHAVIQWAITLIGDVNIKQGKTVISSCIDGEPHVLVDNRSSHPGRLQLGPWGQCNDARSMAYHLPCQVPPPQSPPWRNWQLQEFRLISVLVLKFSHHFSTLPPCLPFNSQVILIISPYFAVLFDLPLLSPVTPSISFIPPILNLYFIALFYIYTYRQVVGRQIGTHYVCMCIHIYTHRHIQFPISLYCISPFPLSHCLLLSSLVQWNEQWPSQGSHFISLHPFLHIPLTWLHLSPVQPVPTYACLFCMHITHLSWWFKKQDPM